MAILTQLCLQLMREFTHQIYISGSDTASSSSNNENAPMNSPIESLPIELFSNQTDEELSKVMTPIAVEFLRRMVRLAEDWGVARTSAEYRDWLPEEFASMMDELDWKTVRVHDFNGAAKKKITLIDGWAQTEKASEQDASNDNDDSIIQAFIERKRQKINESNTREYLDQKPAPSDAPVMEPAVTEDQVMPEETTAPTEPSVLVKEPSAARTTKPSPHLQRATQIRLENARLFHQLNPTSTDLQQEHQSKCTKREFCSYSVRDEGLLQRVQEIELHLGVGGKGPQRHSVTAVSLQPIKRKRGRPRKIQPKMDTTTDDCASNPDRESTPIPSELRELDLSLADRIKRIEDWIIRIEDNDPQLAVMKFSNHREMRKELVNPSANILKIKLSNPVPASSLAPVAVLRAAAPADQEAEGEEDYDEEAESARLSEQGAQMDKRIQQLREKLLKAK